MTTTVATYLVYVALSVAVAIWVGRTLRRYGSIYLADGYGANRELHEALSHLLVVGFYLVSFGVICFVLRVDRAVADTQASIEMLSMKLGTVLVILGAMHFLVLVALTAARKQAGIELRSNLRSIPAREAAAKLSGTLVADAFE